MKNVLLVTNSTIKPLTHLSVTFLWFQETTPHDVKEKRNY